MRTRMVCLSSMANKVSEGLIQECNYDKYYTKHCVGSLCIVIPSVLIKNVKTHTQKHLGAILHESTCGRPC